MVVPTARDNDSISVLPPPIYLFILNIGKPPLAMGLETRGKKEQLGQSPKAPRPDRAAV